MAQFAFVAALIVPIATAVLAAQESGGPPSPVPVYRPIEVRFEQGGEFANPYADVSAEARISGPGGVGWKMSLAWDGDREWLLRFAPDRPGGWHVRIKSDDPGLDGAERGFTVVPARPDDPRRHGGLTVMKDRPHHLARQDGTPFWFLGDTAWALFTDDEKERHDRDAAARYLKARAGQGFNVVHAMLLSEAGWGNASGPPFHDLASETINPAYWREVDERVRLANDRRLTVGLAIGWGEKGRGEPYAWRKFPSDEARERYVRFVAARYAAHDVYFLVSGEWHAEYSAHEKETTEAKERERFERLGRVLDEADPHGRMIGIHPMGGGGSVREFHETGWMTFGDYQQNYDDLHARALQSRKNPGPVVNSEYGYHLRDQNGDGTPDKDNSTSTDAMRHATLDVLMAGGYVVTGFGGTYFGGHRDPGPFDVDAPRHDDWEEQIGHAKEFSPASSGGSWSRRTTGSRATRPAEWTANSSASGGRRRRPTGASRSRGRRTWSTRGGWRRGRPSGSGSTTGVTRRVCSTRARGSAARRRSRARTRIRSGRRPTGGIGC